MGCHPVCFEMLVPHTFPFYRLLVTMDNRVSMNHIMMVDVAALFADAALLAVVRLAGRQGALVVNETTFRGNTPISLRRGGYRDPRSWSHTCFVLLP